jgi:hypothetical protein
VRLSRDKLRRGGSFSSGSPLVDAHGTAAPQIPMTIPITAEAFAAIRAAFSGDWSSDVRPDGKGGYFLRLPDGMVDLLEGIRGPGESYSDAIIRITSSG